MPSSSKKQHNFMAAIANNPAFAKKVGVPQSVGKDFSNADKGKTFKQGGDMATKGVNPFAKFEKSGKDVEVKGKGKEGSKKEEAFDKSQMGMKKGGMAAFEKSGKDVENKGMKEGSKADMASDKKQMMGMKKGGMTKMATGGVDPRVSALMAARPSGPRPQMPAGMRTPMPTAARPLMGKPRPPMGTAPMPAPMKKGGVTKMASGGYTSSADGIAQRGKTEARKVTMNRGGKC